MGPEPVAIKIKIKMPITEAITIKTDLLITKHRQCLKRSFIAPDK